MGKEEGTKDNEVKKDLNGKSKTLKEVRRYFFRPVEYFQPQGSRYKYLMQRRMDIGKALVRVGKGIEVVYVCYATFKGYKIPLESGVVSA